MKARGTGSLYKRGDIWWIQYHFRGKRHRESSGSKRRTDAVALIRKRLGEIGRGRLVGPSVERTTFEELAQMLLDNYEINQLRSIRRVRLSVRHLTEFFGQDLAVDITGDRVQAYVLWRQKSRPKPKAASIQKELSALKRMFTLGIQAKRVDSRPYIPSIKVRNVRKGFFEQPEIQAVIKRLPEEVKPLAGFLYLTGWRIGEVLSLEWSQVDFRSRTVRLDPGTTKNDEGRIFPFDTFPALGDLLKRQRRMTKLVERKVGRIIPSVFHRNGEPIKSFRGAWNRACKEAGLQGQLVHDLRRTAVRNLERAGVPRSVAMKLTGHKTESVYRRYAIVSEADLSEGLKKLSSLLKTDLSEPRKVIYFGSSSA